MYISYSSITTLLRKLNFRHHSRQTPRSNHCRCWTVVVCWSLVS